MVEYFSKQLTPAQQRYPIVELEATALITAVKKWKYFLKDRKFILQTDHRALIFIKSMAMKNSKLGRISIRLQEFNFDIEHIPGIKNQDADAL